MKVEQLNLVNVRGFEQLELRFEPDVNVIAGVNGVGKSGVLQALATLFSRNPANLAHIIEKMVRYRTDGTIVSDDATLDRELNAVLNLNLPLLRNRRKAVLDGFIASLGTGKITSGQWERLARKWGGDDAGELPPYSRVVAYWIHKRQARN